MRRSRSPVQNTCTSISLESASPCSSAEDTYAYIYPCNHDGNGHHLYSTVNSCTTMNRSQVVDAPFCLAERWLRFLRCRARSRVPLAMQISRSSLAMLSRILYPHVADVREPLNDTRHRGIQATSTIPLTLTAIHTREMSAAASEDVRHIVHHPRQNLQPGAIPCNHQQLPAATSPRCICALGPDWLYHLFRSPTSICRLSISCHSSCPGGYADR